MSSNAVKAVVIVAIIVVAFFLVLGFAFAFPLP